MAAPRWAALRIGRDYTQDGDSLRARTTSPHPHATDFRREEDGTERAIRRECADRSGPQTGLASTVLRDTRFTASLPGSYGTDRRIPAWRSTAPARSADR